MPKRIKMTQKELARLGRLLNMMYRPSEVASEIGCKVRRVRTLIDAGCPHVRDDTGHLWVNGYELRLWAEAYNKGNRQPLGDGEAYCMRDNRPVRMMEPITVKPVNRHLELVSGTCPICGGAVNRARARGR